MRHSNFSVYLTVTAVAVAVALIATSEFRSRSIAPAPHDVTEAQPQQPTEAPDFVDVVFVLDATGSMSGLIDGARRTIFDIAGATVAQSPNATLRFGLVAYRDRTDAWTTQVHELTEDVDAIYGALRELQASGGGDRPEAVNDGLHAALQRMAWSDNPSARKTIFLVGDAPPQTRYDDDVPWQQTVADARQQGIRVHAIQCGNDRQTAETWQRIAESGDGRFQNLAQDGNVGQRTTAVDDELARIGRGIGATVVAYGSAAEQAAQRNSSSLSAVMAAPEAAARVTLQTQTGRFGGGRSGDLIDRYGSGTLAFEDIDRSLLSAELQRMGDRELRRYLDERVEARRELAAEAEGAAAARRESLRSTRDAEEGETFDHFVEEALSTD